MKVKYDGKVYEFDPNKQRKVTILDKLAHYVPIRGLKIKLATLSVRLKGIKVTEVTNDNGREDLGGD